MKAATEIAHDNGAINRRENFDAAAIDIDFKKNELALAEQCFDALEESALETVCIGEASESKDILESNFRPDCAELCGKVLNSIFEVI